MCLHELGAQIDIHGGGNDLIFPHHENEIAQTESLTQQPFAQYWMHNGMLQLDGEKMSKSLGNLVTIDDFLADYDADILRLLVLSSSYRAPLLYAPAVVADIERKRERLMSALRPALGDTAPAEASATLEAAAQQARTQFTAAMDDDFNTAAALAALFELVRAINTARDAFVADAVLTEAQSVLRELAGVLGLQLTVAAEQPTDAAPFIELLLDLRTELRQAQQWQLADLVRERLAALDVTLEDGPNGTTWRME